MQQETQKLGDNLNEEQTQKPNLAPKLKLSILIVIIVVIFGAGAFGLLYFSKNQTGFLGIKTDKNVYNKVKNNKDTVFSSLQNNKYLKKFTPQNLDEVFSEKNNELKDSVGNNAYISRKDEKYFVVYKDLVSIPFIDVGNLDLCDNSNLIFAGIENEGDKVGIYLNGKKVHEIPKGYDTPFYQAPIICDSKGDWAYVFGDPSEKYEIPSGFGFISGYVLNGVEKRQPFMYWFDAHHQFEFDYIFDNDGNFHIIGRTTSMYNQNELYIHYKNFDKIPIPNGLLGENVRINKDGKNIAYQIDNDVYLNDKKIGSADFGSYPEIEFIDNKLFFFHALEGIDNEKTLKFDLNGKLIN